ncbi:MAG: aminotransferase class III-fold pyridoxal phosphate-dependent enzyme [Solirubrobacterales bacterium]
MTEAPGRVLSTSLTAGSQPLVVRGEGIWLELDDGRRVIDGTNTAAPLGHAHPEIVEAVRAAATAPAINEGVRWGGRDAAAEALLDTALAGEDWAGAVRFFISAGEANDATLSLAQALSGRPALATRERAYHGGVGLSRELTVQPHWHGGLAYRDRTLAPPRLSSVRELPAPSGARIAGPEPDPEADRAALADAGPGLADVAAVLIDYSQGGIYHQPYHQDQLAELAREAGALWIADETVTGLGRVGRWFQFQAADSRPDIVTMGKGLAAGGAPAGAAVLSRELLERMEEAGWQSYSSYRAHPVEVAAIEAHIRVSARDGIWQRALDFDGLLAREMERLADAHPGISRIDGRGLHWTIEFHGPSWRDWEGHDPEPLASKVAARVLEAGVMIATSGEQTSLFIAPPLIVEEAELMKILEALDHGLALADAEVEGVTG